jgi:hypothetical protein
VLQNGEQFTLDREPNDRFRPAGALVDTPETFIQPDLRIAARRQVRHGPLTVGSALAQQTS